MAKVENPNFACFGRVDCDECPLDYGKYSSEKHTGSACERYHHSHDFDCPRNMEEYAEACRMAEEAT